MMEQGNKRNVQQTKAIYMPQMTYVGILNGKTNTDHVKNSSNMIYPSDIVRKHKLLTIGVDLIYVY